MPGFHLDLKTKVTLQFNVQVIPGSEDILKSDSFLLSKVRFVQVSSYFNPKTWREEKLLKHIAFVEDTFPNDLNTMSDLKMPIYLD